MGRGPAEPPAVARRRQVTLGGRDELQLLGDLFGVDGSAELKVQYLFDGDLDLVVPEVQVRSGWDCRQQGARGGEDRDAE